jgi:CRISPR/Cas system CSM-associated protein Csm3 (group 7 of RAMP superfamily)
MIGFKGEFYSNIALPEKLGLGQSTSRGFGTIKREELI